MSEPKSPPKVGTIDFLRAAEIKAWANVSSEFVRRHMAPDRCLDTRLTYAMILWSWCGPDQSETVVIKDENGWILPDAKGMPQPAKQDDLITLLKLPASAKSHVSRTLAALTEQAILHPRQGALRLILKPPAFFEEQGSTATFQTWTIGNRVVSTDNLPADPAARAVAIGIFESCSTEYNLRLKDLRTGIYELLDRQLSAASISIGFKTQKTLRAKQPSASAAAAALVQENPPPPADPVFVISTQPAEPETELVFEALTRYAIADREAAREIVTRCRTFAPLVPVEAICQIIDAKGPGARNARKPIGLLLTSVPACFEGWQPPAGPDPDLCGRCHGTGMHPIRPQDDCDECAGSGKRVAALAAH